MISRPNRPLHAREAVSNYLFEQILGPTEFSLFAGEPLPDPDANGKIHLEKALGKRQYHDPVTGFPIIQNTRPKMVFGTGILHAPREEEEKSGDSAPDADFEAPIDAFLSSPVTESSGNLATSDSDESSIDESQKYRPSAMGFTAQFTQDGSFDFSFEISGATYEDIDVVFDGKSKAKWYKRVAHAERVVVNWGAISEKGNQLLAFEIPGTIGAIATLQLRWRETGGVALGGSKIKALTAVVAHKGANPQIELFQFSMALELNGQATFASVDSTKLLDRENEEDQEIEFLYRHIGNYAFGHGIAVDWEDVEGKPPTRIVTTVIPSFYQERLETNVDGLSISMSELASLDKREARVPLENLVHQYEAWIAKQKELLESLTGEQLTIGLRLVDKNQHIARRMRKGLASIFESTDNRIFEAFQLANRAMYLQQQKGLIPEREFIDKKGMPVEFPPIVEPDPKDYGTWRPFQIGFLLMAITGIVNPLDEDRSEVDLIFFPTGGGKTEAYLGAAALQIIYRRLCDNSHHGVDVLMRYTLRLLTVQQFERSSGLIVALEHLRRANPEVLGSEPISIGVWLGGDTTPNRRSIAVEILEAKAKKFDQANPFVLKKCPWCSATFSRRDSNKQWIGYKKRTEGVATLLFVCGDPTCEFSRESKALPIWITDDDVYDHKPSFVLGTVDKFAQLSWQPRARTLFNIGDDGQRVGPPPGLIIQDELHLISGPLGSLVGLYEGVIESFCTEMSGDVSIRPKVIASTATTRRYETQVHNLYARENVALFPQAISRANETFFSSVKRLDGVAERGTHYLGINPATYATGQLATSQVSAFLSQAPSSWDGAPEEMDYYSTSMWFFNSLKELGQSLTLLRSTVVSLLNSMWHDARLPNGKTRYLEPIMELTGRISSKEVSTALDDLKKTNTKTGYVRTCLASSIMEVGVDVSRLGLLTIFSQPKLTAQYIQVSGRVGRKPDKGPGLVVMLYNSGRARDRSVYEHFGVFHKRLYAQVEPLSVTPFAIQTMDKGLRGALIALYRIYSPVDVSPTTLNEELFDHVVAILRSRMKVLNSSFTRIEDFERQVLDFKQEWLQYRPIQWVYDWLQEQEDKTSDNSSTALLRRRAKPLGEIRGDRSINIPQSMRDVDGQTKVETSSNVYSFDERLGVRS